MSSAANDLEREIKRLAADPSAMDTESIKHALAGNVDEARELLKRGALALESGTLSNPLARYLADCLFAASEKDGEDAGKAFHLINPKTGRPQGSTTEDHQLIAAAYFYLLQRGYRAGDAKVKLLAELKLSQRRIETAAKTYAPMRDLEQDLLLHMMGGWRQQIGKIPKKILTPKKRK